MGESIDTLRRKSTESLIYTDRLVADTQGFLNAFDGFNSRLSSEANVTALEKMAGEREDLERKLPGLETQWEDLERYRDGEVVKIKGCLADASQMLESVKRGLEAARITADPKSKTCVVPPEVLSKLRGKTNEGDRTFKRSDQEIRQKIEKRQPRPFFQQTFEEVQQIEGEVKKLHSDVFQELDKHIWRYLLAEAEKLAQYLTRLAECLDELEKLPRRTGVLLPADRGLAHQVSSLRQTVKGLTEEPDRSEEEYLKRRLTALWESRTQTETLTDGVASLISTCRTGVKDAGRLRLKDIPGDNALRTFLKDIPKERTQRAFVELASEDQPEVCAAMLNILDLKSD